MLLLASRLSHCLLLTPDSIATLNLTDRIGTTVLGGVLLFALFLPTLLVLRRHPQRGIIDCAYQHSRCCGRVVCGGYAALGIFIVCLDILQFCDFAEKVMSSGLSVTALAIALVAVAFVATFYGIQALGRTAALVTAFASVCLLVFAFALIPEMDVVHFPPTVGQGAGAVVRCALEELPRTAEVVVIGMIYPYVRGSQSRAVAAFCGGTVLLTLLVYLTAGGVLGDFALQTAYPYYTAVTAARIGVFQRMDILITAVWLSTFFIRMTLFCLLFTDSTRRLFGMRGARYAVGIVFVLLAVFSWAVRRGFLSEAGYPITVVYWIVLGVFCVVLPLLLWGLNRIKRRRCV